MQQSEQNNWSTQKVESISEVCLTQHQMKSNKPSGANFFPTELFKMRGKELINRVHLPMSRICIFEYIKQNSINPNYRGKSILNIWYLVSVRL